MSGCVFAANFEEFVSLYGELFTLHINLRQKNCRDFFDKGTRLDRKYFIPKFYFAFIRVLIKPDRVYRRVTQRDFVYTDYRHSFESNYALVGYISIAKERNLVAFFVYTEFPPCRVWLEHWRLNIWLITRLCNPAQFPAQSSFFPAQFAPQIPHNLNFSPAPCQKACIGSCLG